MPTCASWTTADQETAQATETQKAGYGIKDDLLVALANFYPAFGVTTIWCTICGFFALRSTVAGAREYDTAHPYVRTASFDHAGRPTSMTLPSDPDWTGTGLARVGSTTISFNPALSLLSQMSPARVVIAQAQKP